MRIFNYFVAIFWISFLMISCGKVSPKGELISKDIEIEDFTELDLNGKFRVFFVNNPKNFIAIETYNNVADNLNIKVKNNILSINEKSETENVDFYNITIYSKQNPKKITLKDGVELNVSGEIKVNQIKVELKDNAKFIGAISAENADIEMQNLSRANFSGNAKYATIKISDTAGLIAPYWKITNLNLESKNGNYTEVNVKDTLKGFLKNTAKLLYYNEPINKLNADRTTKIENRVL